MMLHRTLTYERWSKLSLAAQFMNISSELSRAQSFERKNEVQHRDTALTRALELLDISIETGTRGAKRREMTRLREMLAGILLFDQGVFMTLADIQDEFEPFALICAREREAGPLSIKK